MVTLRDEPKAARLLLRRLIGPLVLTDDSQRPHWIDAEAEIKTGLLDGIHDVASPSRPTRVYLSGVLARDA